MALLGKERRGRQGQSPSILYQYTMGGILLEMCLPKCRDSSVSHSGDNTVSYCEKTLSADVHVGILSTTIGEILSPIGEILALIWEILSPIVKVHTFS